MWHSKLDVKDNVVRWSCKFTRHESYRLTQDDLTEIFYATTGPGGDASVPAMVIRIGSPTFDVVVLPASEFIRLMKMGNYSIPESKADMKRTRSKIPILYRREGD